MKYIDRSDSTYEPILAVTDPMESFAVSTEENLGREDSTIPFSRAYMRGSWYLPNFGPVHQKAGKPKRDNTQHIHVAVLSQYWNETYHVGLEETRFC